MQIEIDIDDKFMDIFTTGGSVSGDCRCGRTHIAVRSYDTWDEEYEGEVNEIKDSMIAQAEKDDMTILDWENDSIAIMDIGGVIFVAGCECEGWKQYMNFMWEQRVQISRFLIAGQKEFERITEQMKIIDLLKENTEGYGRNA